MIFVTLGSQKFQFNRLLKQIDKLIAEKVITEEVFVQSGYSDYEMNYCKYEKFLDREQFTIKMEMSDIVITHGGTGAIIGAVKVGKKVIAVPRLAKYGEHVDDHQVQLLEQFGDMGIIETCYEINELGEKYLKIRDKEFCRYESNTGRIIEHIDSFLVENY